MAWSRRRRLATPVTSIRPLADRNRSGFQSYVQSRWFARRDRRALAVTAILLPPGLTVPGDPIAPKASEGTVRVQAALEAALGTMTLGLQAKGKIRNSDQTIAVPVVTLAVVRPASVELATAAIDVKAGTTAELKGKIVRKGTFNEPVIVRIVEQYVT